jgi:Fe2+ transport system protein FeoA
VTVRLTSLRVGQEATICECALEPRDASVLRAMGLRHAARVRVCRAGEPFVVEVLYNGSGCSFRIGLARPLAGRVIVADASPV